MAKYYLKDIKREKYIPPTKPVKGNYYSVKDYTGYVFPKIEYNEINFSFSDFTKADLSDCKFINCNFTFCIGLDDVKVQKTLFKHGCDLTGSVLEQEIDTSKCQYRFISEDDISDLIKGFFEEPEPPTEVEINGN